MTAIKYKKSYRTKKKKSAFKILKNNFFWIGLLFFITSIGLLYFFLFSSVFKINEIQINGNKKIETKQIKDIADEQINKKTLFIIPKNILFVNLKKIKTEISKKFHIIGEVSIKRKLFHTIIVDIEERSPIGVWCKPIIIESKENQVCEEENCQNNDIEQKNQEKMILISDSDCFNIDKEGVIFEEGKKETAQLVLKSDKEISFGSNIIEKKYIDIILNIKKQVEEIPQIDIKEFFIPLGIGQGEEKITLITIDDWEIYFNSEKDISNQIFNLKLVLKEKIPEQEVRNLKYIDLRFGSRLFIKYNDELSDIPELELESDSNSESETIKEEKPEKDNQ
ncbi:MAG: FtsQ-type POTRA domain-containing protein [Candidatus Nealsonbacteria bacterium]